MHQTVQFGQEGAADFQAEEYLSMVVKPSMIDFGFEWSVRLEPYCQNFAEGTSFD